MYLGVGGQLHGIWRSYELPSQLQGEPVSQV